MSEYESKSGLIRPSRRSLLTSLGAALSIAAPFVLRNGRAEAQSKNLVFVTWGGTYRSSVEEGLIKPFMAETGINVTVIDTPDLAKVKAQVTTGNVEWDVFDAPGAMGTGGSKEGYWEPLSPVAVRCVGPVDPGDEGSRALLHLRRRHRL
jgi:putative spermidine/putrescine transport system substrate-binding protein